MGGLSSVPILGFFFDDDDNSGSERSAQQRAEQRARELEATVRTLRQEADEARRRAIDAENRVQSVVASSREEIEAVDRARRVARETAENAQRRQEELEQAMHEAEEALQRAEEARLAVERRWFEGVRPERRPSDQDITQMRARHGHSPNFIHLAVLALLEVRSHPSSTPSVACPIMILPPLVRGLSKLPIIPQVTLTHVQTPGSFGTPNVPDWQYFNDLGLYIFDCIIILIDSRVLESDLAILSACRQFTNIEAFIVRSKSDQHINNMVYDRMPSFDPHDFDIDDETRRRFLQIRSEERRRFINETRQNARMNLEGSNLAPQRVYRLQGRHACVCSRGAKNLAPQSELSTSRCVLESRKVAIRVVAL
ncbi:hypothetical protein CY34DRAFT_104770 [Suillus luteus UH-Slu-Lm8-n1]|uniref:IRG-type G domain-containing protein n=1 Tax=Suillus luteus UH-Slu-Lm8-n1 TaxID=930992 RepID=A0A0D0BMF0_9AGAM|nr:hypothetical protein CY34DRAFT_104770 [Suillus luteus UH-Slu-Lm8-n1]